MRQNWRADQPEAVMPAGGATPRHLALSADATQLAFSQQFAESAIWSLSLDPAGSPRGEARPLIQNRSWLNCEPAFSPDGAKIAFTSIREGVNPMVWVANADGSAAAPITPADQRSARPTWFGKDLAVGYQVFRNGEWSYWVSPLQGQPKRIDLKLDLRLNDRLRISSDGTQIVAHATTPSGFQVVVEDLKSGTVRSITPPGRNIGFPFWSPDGHWIGAVERIRGNSSFVIIPAAGGQPVTVGIDGSVVSDWAPDGDRVVYSSRTADGNTWNAFWISRSTGRARQLTQFQPFLGRLVSLAWSPRNDQIVFERDKFLGANIYVAALK